MALENSEQRAPAFKQQVIEALHGLALNDQLSILVSLLFSHIAAGSPANADQIVSNVIASLPENWRRSKAMFLYGSLPN